MAMKKKAAAPEPAGESAPMWIVSFADLVTLLMSFFVVLYAMKQDGAKQETQVAAAIKSVFDPGYEPPTGSMSEFDQAVRRYRGAPGPPSNTLPGDATKVSQGADGANKEVQTIRAGKDIVTGTKINFEAGKIAISESDQGALAQIADHVRGLNNVLMVKGHASADELAMRPDDLNGMMLSYQRAMAVTEALVKMGIDRRVLRPVACGAFEPVKVGVYDAAGLKMNRRVEVYTTDYTASDYFPDRTIAPATEGAATTESKDAKEAPAATQSHE